VWYVVIATVIIKWKAFLRIHDQSHQIFGWGWWVGAFLGAWWLSGCCCCRWEAGSGDPLHPLLSTIHVRFFIYLFSRTHTHTDSLTHMLIIQLLCCPVVFIINIHSYVFIILLLVLLLFAFFSLFAFLEVLLMVLHLVSLLRL